MSHYVRGKRVHVSGHLDCFHGSFSSLDFEHCDIGRATANLSDRIMTGGNWIMGGKLLDNKTILDYGLRLTDACVNTYLSTEYILFAPLCVLWEFHLC